MKDYKEYTRIPLPIKFVWAGIFIIFVFIELLLAHEWYKNGFVARSILTIAFVVVLAPLVIYEAFRKDTSNKQAQPTIDTFSDKGYQLLQHAITRSEIKRLIRETEGLHASDTGYGVRNLMDKVPYVRTFANSKHMRAIVEAILGDGAKPVRAIYFDKNPDANWNVAWHQDTTIAVDKRMDLPGYGPWSEKEGVVHVEPPEEILQNMVTLRIHLDKTDASNGVLRVIPGSHQHGRLPSAKILELAETSEIVECTANPGDVLVMSPLILHASRKSVEPKHRRIIHIEYSASELPEGLEWNEFRMDKLWQYVNSGENL